MLDTFKKATPEALEAVMQEKRIRQTQSLILLFSMGSQFDHLIYQQVSKLGVYCLVADPASVTAEDVRALAPSGIIVSGGPASVHSEPPPFDNRIFDIGIPILGICLGFQMWARQICNAKVLPAQKREFGVHRLLILGDDPLFAGISDCNVLQSHGDSISDSSLLVSLGNTSHAPIAAARYSYLWGVQFHPEVSDSECGAQLFANFCFGICGITDTFPANEAVFKKNEELIATIRKKTIVLAISGGSDSSVVAYLLKNAASFVKAKIHGIYIKGVDRADDEAHVRTFFGEQDWMSLEVIDATDRFLEVMKGITKMRDKRLAMKGVYRDILQEGINRYQADFLAEGTLYTDLVESGEGLSTGARRAVIKTHHNTGNTYSVPLLLPLSDCVKDSARDIGREIGVPEELLVRHPFPGPGRTLRIEGEVTREKLAIEGKADEILIEELRRHDLYESVWQAGAVLTSSRCTCTKGDDAAEGWVICCWAVWSVNGFTARPARLPHDFMELVSDRITNEIREAGAVVFRTSGKPPATIEWG